MTAIYAFILWFLAAAFSWCLCRAAALADARTDAVRHPRQQGGDEEGVILLMS